MVRIEIFLVSIVYAITIDGGKRKRAINRLLE